MKFKKISNKRQDLGLYKDFMGIYNSSFPKDERRDAKQQNRLFGTPRYYPYAVYEGNMLVGIAAYWLIGNFCFLEHIAVAKALRGKGHGTRILNYIAKRCKNRDFIVLEAGLPRNKKARSVIRFYKKNEFELTKFKYMQPAYSKSKKPVKLRIMVLKLRIRNFSPAIYKRTKERIYGVVYGLKKKDLGIYGANY